MVELQAARDVGEPAPQAVAFKLAEPEVAIEAGGVIRRGVDDHGAGAELTTASRAPSKCIDQEVTAECCPLLGAVERQAREQHDWDRIGHPTAQSRWRVSMSDRTHGQGVVADDSLTAAQHIDGGGAGSGRGV